MKFRAILNDKYDLEEIAQRKQSARPHHKTLIYFAVGSFLICLLVKILTTNKSLSRGKVFKLTTSKNPLLISPSG